MPAVNTIKGYASYAPAAAFLGAEAAGLPAHETAFPGPVASLSTGLLTGASLYHSGGLHFGGAFGYKTFFSGIGPGAISTYSLGGSMLSVTEAIGKEMWNKGVQNKYTAWMSSASKLGLTGLSSSKEFTSYSDALEYARIAEGRSASAVAPNSTRTAGVFKSAKRAGHNQGNKITRFLGGQGENVEEAIVKKLATEGKDDVWTVMLRHKADNFIVKGKWWARAGTIGSAASWMALAAPVVRWGGEQIINSAAGRIGELSSMLSNTNFHMGRGYAPQTFNNQQAATERQRAVQAIYASKVNPSNRMYGNEASHYHR